MPDLRHARRGAFDALTPPAASVTLLALPPQSRLSFRGREPARAAAGAALGVTLPETACRAATTGTRTALWLGPDEWLVLAPDGEAAGIAAGIAEKLAGMPHSLVEVSDRYAALQLLGTEAATVLSAGCPLDLDPAAFPVGMCTRTVLGKAEIVLWRIADTGFRIEMARSFGSYVWDFLAEALREFQV